MGKVKKAGRLVILGLMVLASGVMAQSAQDAFNRGFAALRNGNYDLAIKEFTECILLKPNEANAYKYRGAAYALKDNYIKSKDDLEKSLQLNPNDSETKKMLAETNKGCAKDAFYRGDKAYKNKNYDLAIKEFTESIKLNPNLTDSYRNRGIIYALTENYTNAINDFEKCLRINPNDSQAKEMLSDARKKAGSGSSSSSAPKPSGSGSSGGSSIDIRREIGSIFSRVMVNPNRTYNDGTKYKGSIVYDKRDGYGIYKFNTGSYYAGMWSAGNMHYWGMFVTEVGMKYGDCSKCAILVGDFISDMASGTGTCYDSNGNVVYEGTFYNDKPTGTYPSTGSYSTYKFQILDFGNGEKYVGETKGGKRHGYGVNIFKDGDMWIGMWKDGSRSGGGMYSWYNGSWRVQNCQGDNCQTIMNSGN